ncbi:MAG: Nucleoside-diphosphate-sugar pyrophosphorylase involved in lipopolysaccharide biosynthesis/translation initiation factor 2B, gamma/epsilon subunits (eIF-2Bgamma/eIF-2Bepsilon) [uncultured Acidilobus sp. OSP8]|nr:MAG: Nucleoside-diphosphate-sugar pyrophosphorylase involved in lipopolysaccharide biosynthesis/translation initiation factor 2B, gamma/epsilon subunits (eIF-2Bgamma/eIF-2Bepsilon) [uncultured Acidilobus sp. OSP8]
MVGLIAEVKKAAVPIGGLGTRLYPFTVDTSKPMVRFLNRFIIDFILDELAKQGVGEVFLGVSGFYNYRDLYDHLGERFYSRLPDGKRTALKLRYQPNVNTIGNAHSISVLADYYDITDKLLVVQGDTIISLNLGGMLKRHEESEAYMTIALKPVHDKEALRQLGLAKLRSDDTIEAFVEKPADPEKAPSNLANTGVYLLSEEMIKFLRSEEFKGLVKEGRADFGRDIIPYIISRGHKVMGFITNDFWFDIGTLESYVQASFYLLRSLPPERLGATMVYHDHIYMQGASARSKRDHIDLIERTVLKKIELSGWVLIGRHVDIEDGSAIIDSIVDNYVILSKGSLVKNSIVMDRSIVGQDSVIENSVIGRHVKVGNNVKIVNSYVGNDVVIGDNTVVVNSSIWPHKVIESNAEVRSKRGPSI